MFDKNRLPKDAKEYFDSLPKFLQETIMQSGMEFSSRDELSRFHATIRR